MLPWLCGIEGSSPIRLISKTAQKPVENSFYETLETADIAVSRTSPAVLQLRENRFKLLILLFLSVLQNRLKLLFMRVSKLLEMLFTGLLLLLLPLKPPFAESSDRQCSLITALILLV